MAGTVTDDPDQQHSAIHLSHSARLPVVEQPMHAPEDAGAPAAHPDHLSMNGVTPDIRARQRCPDFG
jgi:hypothetical protein